MHHSTLACTVLCAVQNIVDHLPNTWNSSLLLIDEPVVAVQTLYPPPDEGETYLLPATAVEFYTSEDNASPSYFYSFVVIFTFSLFVSFCDWHTKTLANAIFLSGPWYQEYCPLLYIIYFVILRTSLRRDHVQRANSFNVSTCVCICTFESPHGRGCTFWAKGFWPIEFYTRYIGGTTKLGLKFYS